MTIYLDVVWLLNLLLDLMILRLTASLAKAYARPLSLLMAAIVAATIVPFAVYYPDALLLHPIGKVGYSFIIIWVGFGGKNIKRFMHIWLIFYFVTFVIGGGLTAVHFMFSNPNYLTVHSLLAWTTGFGDPVSWLFVIIGFPIVWLFTRKTMDKQSLTNYRHQQQFKVMINVIDKQIITTGYLDSANHLVDPISKKPVIIVDQTVIDQLFSEKEINQLKHAQESLDLMLLEKRLVNYVHFVPYQGLSAGQGLILVVKINQLLLFDQDKMYTCSKVLIGLQFKQLTPDDTYHCLLNPQIFKKIALQTA